MTLSTLPRMLDFELPDELIATRPVETVGLRRDGGRMLVSWRSSDRLVDAVVSDLPRFLRSGDVLVVNTSATLPAAVPTGDGRLVHLSTELPGGAWIVELRQPCGTGSRPLLDAVPGDVPLPGGARLTLLTPFPLEPRPAAGPVRLWLSQLDVPVPLGAYLARHGHPIRYGCGDESWPISAYQTVFAHDPGSAEMPSAARGFTAELVAQLVSAGIVFAPITLHTGVSSQEAGEPPYPERFVVPATTAELVESAIEHRHRIIAVGTTATRAIETVADEHGHVHPGSGWTDLVITPERGVRIVDGILSGWHEPEASHLALLEAVGGVPLLERSYQQALRDGYRWHEFGDFHLILP